jgi:hypothetical protein
MTDIAQSKSPPPPPPQPQVSGEAERDAGPSGRAKKEPVTSLMGYLGSRTSATSFLKHLREAEVWSFDDRDREEALRRHRELDPRFTKTASLLAQSFKAKDERHVFPVSEIAREALVGRLGDYPHWIGTQWDELAPDQRAIKVADAVRQRFTDPKKGREAQNVFATALLLLGQESLEFETALRATARALEARAEATPRWNRERVRFVAGPRSKVAELRLLIQTVLPWLERADANESALEEARLDADRERRRGESAEAAVTARDEDVRRLETEVANLARRIEELDEELKSSRVHGSHSLDRTRSASRAFLEGRLLSLLQTAVEALELDPPRPHIAREKLDVAREAIEEQLRWLEQ